MDSVPAFVDADQDRHRRGNYDCNKCGEKLVGHVCDFVKIEAALLIELKEHIHDFPEPYPSILETYADISKIKEGHTRDNQQVETLQRNTDVELLPGDAKVATKRPAPFASLSAHNQAEDVVNNK